MIMINVSPLRSDIPCHLFRRKGSKVYQVRNPVPLSTPDALNQS